MNMTIVIGAIAAGFIVLAIGGGIGYFFWISSRPKKMIWNAKVYQVGDGVIPPDKDEKGNNIREYMLSDLKPYAMDIIERIDKKSGATYYWLQRMKKAVPVVTADCVEIWGKDKLVNVLLEGDTTTLLKSGYDRKLGQKIFKPMPHDRINMIKTEIEERKARIQDSKDILAQIAPFVTIGISMLALVCIVYLSVQGAVKITEMNNAGADAIAKEIGTFRKDLLAANGCLTNEQTQEVKQENPPVMNP
jgi:hypothetical protein